MEIKIKNIDEFAKQFISSMQIAMAHQGRGFEHNEIKLIVGEFVKNLKSNSE